MEKEEIILGIDPGTNVMGYSFVKKTGKKIEVLEMDVLKLGNKEEMATRMKTIFDFIIKKIDVFHPDMLALEAPFYYKNVQSMLKLGRVQGICIAAGLSRDIPFTEFPPKRVKQSITGNGNASKEQVMKMLQMMKLIDENPKYAEFFANTKDVRRIIPNLVMASGQTIMPGNNATHKTKNTAVSRINREAAVFISALI